MESDFAKMVREQIAGYRAANEFQLEEKRQRAPEASLRLAQVFLDRLAKMDRLPAREDEELGYQRWQQLREKWLERNTES